jgi:hypothetical protein
MPACTRALGALLQHLNAPGQHYLLQCRRAFQRAQVAQGSLRNGAYRFNRFAQEAARRLTCWSTETEGSTHE